MKAFLNLLTGINAEAAELLKDKSISSKALQKLRQVNGVRQVEIAELLVSANNYTNSHVEALILGTPKDQFAKPLASACIRKLLDNAAVAGFLKTSQADIFAEFEKIAAAGAL